METPKPKPRRKRGCAREGCKRRPHELNRNPFALRPPDRSACGAPSPASRSFVLARYLASVGQGFTGLLREWGVRAGAPSLTLIWVHEGIR